MPDPAPDPFDVHAAVPEADPEAVAPVVPRRPTSLRTALALGVVVVILALGAATPPIAARLASGQLLAGPGRSPAPSAAVLGAVGLDAGGTEPLLAGPDPAATTPGPTPSPIATPVPTPVPPRMLGGYRWPLTRGRLTTNFGPTGGATWVVDGERFHDGIDIASFCGDTIRAAHDGVVLVAGRRFDRYLGWDGSLETYEARVTQRGGWGRFPITVVVDDGNGYRSIYAHLSHAIVRRGDRVRAGDPIGREGRTGHATGCHLHYGIFSPLDPRRFALRADLVAKWGLPAREIARIDPRDVLPPRPRTIRLGWGVTPVDEVSPVLRRMEAIEARLGDD